MKIIDSKNYISPSIEVYTVSLLAVMCISGGSESGEGGNGGAGDIPIEEG